MAKSRHLPRLFFSALAVGVGMAAYPEYGAGAVAGCCILIIMLWTGLH